MNINSPQDVVEQLNLMLASATATVELLQKQLASAKAITDLLSGAPLKIPAIKSPEEKTTRDTSRWELDGIPYPKGRFLLKVFEKLVKDKMSLMEVEQHFNSDKVFGGESIVGNRILYQLADDVKDKKRFHMHDTIRTKDGKELVVSNQFGVDNFRYVLRYLRSHFGIQLKMSGENPYTDEWKKRLDE